MRLIKLLFINLLYLLFIVTVIELVVMVIFPDIPLIGDSSNLYRMDRYGSSFGLAPNIKGYSYSAEVITDARGFRIDPSLSTSTKEHTILVVGDSLSFGLGVAASDAFPYLLQRQLRNYQIINSSVNGYSAEDYYNVLNNIINSGLVFEGIIVSICLNDFSTESQAFMRDQISTRYNINYPNKIMRFFKYILDNYIGVNKFLMEYSRTYRLLKSLVIDTSKNYFLGEKTMYDAPDIETVIENGFMKIYEMAKKNGKWIVFFVCPFEYQLRQTSYSNPNISKPQKMINDIAEKNKLPIIDLLPLFKRSFDRSGMSSENLYLFNDSMHFSPIGHHIAAQLIHEEITKRGLIGQYH